MFTQSQCYAYSVLSFLLFQIIPSEYYSYAKKHYALPCVVYRILNHTTPCFTKLLSHENKKALSLFYHELYF